MSSAAASTGRPVDGSFIRSRLGSFLAVVPLTIWTIDHLWNNLAAFKGAEAWQSQVTEYSHPIAFVASSLVALLPLALHTIWGIGRLRTSKVNIARYPYFSNLKYILQVGRPEPFADIAHEMAHHVPTLLVYTLGVLGVSYHLANGLHTFAMGWGIATSRRALRKLQAVIWVVFLGMLAMGWGSIYALYDAGSQLPATTVQQTNASR